MEVEDEDDLEFAALVWEFTPDILAWDYINFDADLQASEPMINNQEIGWWERAREDAINAAQNPTHPSIEISDGEDNNEGCEGNIDEENKRKTSLVPSWSQCLIRCKDAPSSTMTVKPCFRP